MLIVSYYWPPAGGPGVQRWLKFVTYLPKHNITPVVYIPENPNYPIVDSELLKETPDVELLKQPISEPYKWANIFSKRKTKQASRGIISSGKQSLTERILLFIRGNFFIPDARKSWVKPSVTYLSTYLKDNKVDAIITTGPPHSMHLIGKELQEKTDLPWFADFRDPWTTIGYHKKLKLTPWAASKHKSLEREVLQTADQIIVTSPTTKSEFKTITNKPIKVITNGYDTKNRVVAPGLTKTFSISHIGSLLAARNPEILWQVLNELCAEVSGFKEDLNLCFAGYVAPEIKASLTANNLAEYTDFKGYVSHDKALAMQASSQLLLIIEIDAPETRCIIPGKLFEYFMAKRPILAIGPKGSDIQGLIKHTQTGAFFDYSSKASIKNSILASYKAFKKNKLTVNSINIDAFDRENLTQQLADLIKSKV